MNAHTFPRHALLPVLALAAAALPGQSLIHTIHGTTPYAQFASQVAALDDIDGDGAMDFIASEPGTGTSDPGKAYLYSGATCALLATYQGALAAPYTWGLGTQAINTIGDVNGDGKRDVAIGYHNVGVLDVFSGASGTRLYRMGPAIEHAQYACDLGDLDNDGTPEFAAVVKINGNGQLWAFRGATGMQHSIIDTQAQYGRLHRVGDVNNDGRPEFVCATGRYLDIYRSSPPGRLRRINLPANSNTAVFLGADDWNSDGRVDVYVQLAVSQQPYLYVFDMITGMELASFTMTGINTYDTPRGMSMIGDFDLDGLQDYVVRVQEDPFFTGVGEVAILSGATGARLGAWVGNSQFPGGSRFAGLGDVDNDGFPDFVSGSYTLNAQTGGLQVISGRTTAAIAPQPVNCHTGPFPPELGVTRPILGLPCTIAGRDAPIGAPGFVVMSLMPPNATNLGVSGCDAWFDLGGGVLLGQPSQAPNWSMTLPLPNAHQLTGIELALQAFYVDTNSPIGLDLTNGIWARLGY